MKVYQNKKKEERAEKKLQHVSAKWFPIDFNVMFFTGFLFSILNRKLWVEGPKLLNAIAEANTN